VGKANKYHVAYYLCLATIMKTFKIFLIIIALLSVSNVFAQPLRVAVAANAQGLIKKLQADFKKRTGVQTEIILGASGKLTTQILNGAPYDVFLSADTDFPEQLYAKGFGLEKPVTYAMGSLIICGSDQLDIKNWQSLLNKSSVSKVAIANPKTAPYGKAAIESLRFYKLEEKVKSKLVQGESISQVNTYLQTGAVKIGFTTEALLYELPNKAPLHWARVDPKSYNPIAQSAILLTHAKKGKFTEASKFFDYLTSVDARRIINNSGYHLPAKNK
jgi:molybdate transport system substrate-binding protein